MSVYYNENDVFAAAWLAELMKDGLIPHGKIDTRSIADVTAADVRGFTQVHFFAGIGGWAYALALAGWGDRPVRTCSCPCPPYSVASVGHGGAKGPSDSRDLWPEYWRIERELEPTALFGEQVANALSWGWWDRCALDLEAKDYAVAAAVLPAWLAGAVHKRERLFWVADPSGAGRARYQPVECFSESAATSQSLYSDPFVRARRALGGDFNDLLPCDGLSVVLERSALKGYGNAIVPQVAAEFVVAYMETLR